MVITTSRGKEIKIIHNKIIIITMVIDSTIHIKTLQIGIKMDMLVRIRITEIIIGTINNSMIGQITEEESKAETHIKDGETMAMTEDFIQPISIETIKMRDGIRIGSTNKMNILCIRLSINKNLRFTISTKMEMRLLCFESLCIELIVIKIPNIIKSTSQK